MTDAPPRYHPATPAQIRSRRGMSSFPADPGLYVLMWQDEAFTIQAIYGQWRENEGLIACPVLTRGTDLPAVPTHWGVA